MRYYKCSMLKSLYVIANVLLDLMLLYNVIWGYYMGVILHGGYKAYYEIERKN